MKFIHTADLHLASPFQGLTTMPDRLWKKIYNSTFTAFQKIVDAAIDDQVDFVLIAGDIYDGERKSIAATNFFTGQMERLNQHQIPVFLCYGNHDFRRIGDGNTGLPANVHVFSNQVSTQNITLDDGTTVAITGFSYGQRWIDDDLTVDYPVKSTADWHLGMLHGALRQVDNNHYAPFTLDELKSKHYDYWALGHIHKHQVLSSNPPVVYSGNPQGRHKNEAGAHGYYFVRDAGGRLKPDFRPVAGIEWSKVAVDLSSCSDWAAADQTISQAVAAERDGQFQLVDVQVSAADEHWQALVENGGLLSHLQDEASSQGDINWWPYQANLVSHESGLPKLAQLDQQYWQEAAKEVFTAQNLAEIVKPLAKHEPLYELLADHQELSGYRQQAGELLQGTKEEENEN